MLEARSDAAISLKRAAEMAANFMIGDGVLGATQPERHVTLWRSKLRGVDALVRLFANQPRRRRLYGVAQIIAGLILARRLRR